jgi:hypothetical protein
MRRTNGKSDIDAGVDADKATSSNAPKGHKPKSGAPKSDATIGAKSGKAHGAKSNASESGVWKTKFGPRRVRNDPPTLEEAIIAASGLTDDPSEQAEIAASLMGVSAEQVLTAMKASGAQQRQVETVVFARGARGPRSVVVERKPARRMISRPADR